MTPLKLEWPFKGSKYRGRIWRFNSRIAQTCAFGLAKLWTSWPLSRKKLYNVDSFQTLIKGRAAEMREKGETIRPLLTISNHTSCIDDPLLWGGLLSWKQLSSQQTRWVPVAAELCFTNHVYSWLFGRGKCVPVVRGQGVYQRGIDFCVQRLNEGSWVHIFPEGKINMDNSRRLKWGVGRLIAESKMVPEVIPIWHLGMDDILPNRSPYISRIRQAMAIYIGQPIGLEDLVKEWKEQIADPMLLRKKITDYLEAEFWRLKDAATKHHQLATGSVTT